MSSTAPAITSPGTGPTALETVLAGIRIPGLHRGRARTRPEAVIAGRTYPAAAYRAMLHKRGITVVIPQKSDQIAARKRQGAKAGDLRGWTSKPARDATLQDAPSP